MTLWTIQLPVEVPDGRLTWLLKGIADAAEGMGCEVQSPVPVERVADVPERAETSE